MESAAALEKTYGFAHEKLVEYMNTMIIGRFTKPGMSDPISRVAREPIRKISANDRIMDLRSGVRNWDLTIPIFLKAARAH